MHFTFCLFGLFSFPKLSVNPEGTDYYILIYFVCIWLYTCVYTIVCMSTCVYDCVCECVYDCVWVCVYDCVSVCVYDCMCTWLCLCACVYDCVCIWLCVCICVWCPMEHCGGHKTMSRSWFPPSILRVSGFKLGLSGLVVSSFIHWAVSLSQRVKK